MPATVLSPTDLKNGWTLGEDPGTADLDENYQIMNRLIRKDFGERAAAHSGLDYGYHGGVAVGTGAPVAISEGVQTLADDDTNFVERDEDGAITDNVSGFSTNRIPMAVVTTVGGAIITVVDWRPTFSLAPRTGWAAWTGSATRTTIATGSATTVNNAEAIKAIIDDLISLGIFRS